MEYTGKKPHYFAITGFDIFIRRLLILTLISYLALPCASQTNDLQQKQFALSAPHPTLLPDSIIESKLVELALQGPLIKSASHQNKIDEYQLKTAKSAWTNMLTISANYNDRTFSKVDPTSNLVYPKYYSGITIPLGTLFSRTAVKAAREQLEIGRNNQEISERNLKMDVLSKYSQFKALSELIVSQQQVVDDFQAAFLENEKKYSDKSITIEVYNLSSKNYNDEKAKLINLQLQKTLIQLDIERLIGVPLESILYSSQSPASH